MMSDSKSCESCKKPQFGTRFLMDPETVFQYNAWDDIEWNEELTKEAENRIKLNSEILVPSAKQEEYENKANIFWDNFYNIHQNRFFKDRHWLFTEFPELCLLSNSENVPDEPSESSLSVKERCITNSSSNNCGQTLIWEVGCGVGNTVFPILDVNSDANLFVYCCDFSESAISYVKGHSHFDEKRCHPFLCDISSNNLIVPFEKNSLDYILLIFVLSAIHPDKMHMVVNNLTNYLKPGGHIFFRDYGRYDMVELRFKCGQCLADHFYVRGDGTRVYFFTEDQVNTIFENAGLLKMQLYSSRRLQVNRGKQLKMYRIWIQGKYMKPISI